MKTIVVIAVGICMGFNAFAKPKKIVVKSLDRKQVLVSEIWKKSPKGEWTSLGMTDEYGSKLINCKPGEAYKATPRNLNYPRSFEYPCDPPEEWQIEPGIAATMHIYYDPNTSIISIESKAELKKMDFLVKSFPEAVIGIESYTDTVGSAIFNKSLAKKRTLGVAHYFIDKGITADRLVPKAYGESKIFVSSPKNLTLQGMRTTTVTIIVPRSEFGEFAFVLRNLGSLQSNW
jgi:outer membrane protein OmpA-like peptidoglycan-associated protein